MSEVLFFDNIPCIPPGRICDIAYAFQKRYVEQKGEMGRESFEQGIENQYSSQYFKISLRRYGTKFAEILIETVWDDDHSIVRATGKYFGAGWEYEKRYIETKELMLDVLEKLKDYTTKNCYKLEIRILLIRFVSEVLHLRLT